LKSLISAGPTREPIDDVRFLSNRSSGKMGYALARAFSRLGPVTLVRGAVELPRIKGVRVIAAETAREMNKIMQSEAQNADCIVMAAAVADYRPAKRVRGKIHKRGSLTLKLVLNVDILSELGRKRNRPLLIGFALEPRRGGLQSARKKLRSKKVDAMVLNYLDAMGSEKSSGCILLADGGREPFEGVSKSVLAGRIARLASRLVARRKLLGGHSRPTHEGRQCLSIDHEENP